MFGKHLMRTYSLSLLLLPAMLCLGRACTGVYRRVQACTGVACRRCAVSPEGGVDVRHQVDVGSAVQNQIHLGGDGSCSAGSQAQARAAYVSVQGHHPGQCSGVITHLVEQRTCQQWVGRWRGSLE